MASENADQYGMRIRNIAGSMIDEITNRPAGVPVELMAGVVVAQSNLAIAASIAELADVLRRRT